MWSGNKQNFTVTHSQEVIFGADNINDVFHHYFNLFVLPFQTYSPQTNHQMQFFFFKTVAAMLVLQT